MPTYSEIGRSAVADIDIVPKVTTVFVTASTRFASLDDVLTCSYIYYDANNDVEEGSEVSWHTTDETVSDALRAELRAHNDVDLRVSTTEISDVYCKVTPKNRMDVGETVASAPRSIYAPPAILSMSMTPINGQDGKDGYTCTAVVEENPRTVTVQYSFYGRVNFQGLGTPLYLNANIHGMRMRPSGTFV